MVEITSILLTNVSALVMDVKPYKVEVLGQVAYENMILPWHTHSFTS